MTTEEKATAILNYLQQKLAPGALTLFGCPIGKYSFAETGNITGDSLQETGPGGGQAYYKPG